MRWAATLLNHLVFADEDNKTARDMLAGDLYPLGFESEAGTWRNIYLTGAQELRDGPVQLPPGGLSPDVLSATTTADAARFRGRARQSGEGGGASFKLNIDLTDREETHLITVGNGVLIHEDGIAIASRRDGPHEAARSSDDAVQGMPFAPRIESGDITIEATHRSTPRWST